MGGSSHHECIYLSLCRSNSSFDLMNALLIVFDLQSMIFTKFIVLRSEKFTFWDVFLLIRTLSDCWTCRLGTLAIGISMIPIIFFRDSIVTNVKINAVFSWCLNMLITILRIYWIICYKKANILLFLVPVFFSFSLFSFF
jgi:hypothetical protein